MDEMGQMLFTNTRVFVNTRAFGNQLETRADSNERLMGGENDALRLNLHQPKSPAIAHADGTYLAFPLKNIGLV